MIERQFVSQRLKEFRVQEFVEKNLKRVGHSHTKVQRTPLGEKIIIFASRPGLVVGRKGQNIKKLTQSLKKNFDLENPQIEINEVENINLDPKIVAERIADSLERFGTKRFKGIGHKMLGEVMKAGALGVEILISGKIPSSRSKRWRFYNGYLKKCGNLSVDGVLKAYTHAQLKTGIVGIQVRIMPPGIVLPDDIKLVEEVVEEVTEEDSGEEELVEEIEEPETKEEKKPKKKVKNESKRDKSSK